MFRFLVAAFMGLAFVLPATTFAEAPSTFSSARSLLVSSSSVGNQYATGGTVTITAPVGGDITAFGGSIVVAAPVVGDALLFGGSMAERSPLSGDLRAFGGGLSVEAPVKGDLVMVGVSAQAKSPIGGSVFIVAADASVLSGATGPVIIYGNNVVLGGDFKGDVHVVAGGKVTLMASTTIPGTFSYEAPELASIPPSAVIGNLQFKSASYLPGVGASRVLALASIGIFLLVRILGALILAGLLAGLFPQLAAALTNRVSCYRARPILLTTLLGFAVLVATPILLALLALTFIGLGIAILLLLAYGLLVVLSFLYAGIILGALFARHFERRNTIIWRDGVLGMFFLSLLTLLPFIGWFIVFLCMMFAAGALLLLFFHYAFPHEEAADVDLVH